MHVYVYFTCVPWGYLLNELTFIPTKYKVNVTVRDMVNTIPWREGQINACVIITI